MRKTYLSLLFTLAVTVGVAQTTRSFDFSKRVVDNSVKIENEAELKKIINVTEKASTTPFVSNSFTSMSDAFIAQKKHKAPNADLFGAFGRPDGLFYEGLFRDFNAYSAVFMHYPAASLTYYFPYTNNQDAAISWHINDANESSIASMVIENDVLAYDPSLTSYMGKMSYVPMMKAKAGSETISYVLGQDAVAQVGYPSKVDREEPANDGTELGEYEEFSPLTLVNLHEDGGNLYTGYSSGEAFSPQYSNEDGACVGVMQVIPQLAGPMYVESISVLAIERDGEAFPDGGELQLYLYYLNEDGTLGELLAESTTNEFVKTYDPRGVFIFKFEEEEFGLTFETPVTLGTDAPIALLITGFESNMHFNIYMGGNNWGGGAYTIHGEDMKLATFGYSNAPDTPSNDLYIQFNGIFNALASYDRDELELDFPEEGGWGVSSIDEENGTKYNDLWLYSAFKADENLEDIWIEDAPDWITGVDIDNDYFENENIPNSVLFFFEADALPEGESYREGEIILASYGVQLPIKVTQGTDEDTSVDRTQSSDIKVSTTDNAVSVKYPAGYNQISVFNTAGQLIGAHSLPSSGEFAIPNSSAKGVYILKLEGEKTAAVKVLK